MCAVFIMSFVTVQCPCPFLPFDIKESKCCEYMISKHGYTRNLISLFIEVNYIKESFYTFSKVGV